MSISFLQTTRALNADNFSRYIFALSIAVVLLLVWLAWLLLAQVAIYQTSVMGHIQLTSSESKLSLNHSGVVKTVEVTLGQKVKAGDVLVVLDHAHLDSGMAKNKRTIDDLTLERQSLSEQKQVLLSQQRQQLTALDAQLLQLKGREQLASETVDLESQLVQKYNDLSLDNIGSEVELLKAQKALVAAKLSLNQANSVLQQATLARQAMPAQHQQALLLVAQNIAQVDSQISQQNERLNELALLRQQHIVRAPAAGFLAAMTQLQPGKFVERGDTLGTIVPKADYRVEGQFTPDDALGQIDIGQLAKVRLIGTPWTQYGDIEAEVSQVAGAIQDGLVRVQLRLIGPLPPALVLRQDLPVSVEIATEQLSPMALLMRTGGVWLNQPNTSTNKATTLGLAGERQ